MKNSSYWEEIETLPPFQEGQPHYDEVWSALEKFQLSANKQLNAVSLIALDSLLKKIYTAGYTAGRQSRGLR